MSTTAPTTMRKVMIWLAPVLIVVLAVVLIFVAQKDDNAGAQNPKASTPAPAGSTDSAEEDGLDDELADYADQAQEHRVDDIARRDENDPMAIGDVDAPVSFVVYSDFQCSFCAMWSDRSQDELIEKYVDSGDVRIEWRDIDMFGPNSEQGAKAAYAAAQQGKYRTFHDALFAGGNIRSEGDMTPEALVELAQELALDAEQFEIDMRSDETAAAVQANVEDGRDLGVIATPSFLINGIPVSGAQPTELFTTLIDNELAQKN